ncbi:MAG TPA: hypothetical protein PKY76_00270 [Bacteroidales bacterium]|nr:hypothetical protein [Bacteroidales bacterium]
MWLLMMWIFWLAQPANNISFQLESKTLSNQKVVVIKADIFFKYDEGRMITHYTYPTELISITNNKGEASFYDPKSNTVVFKRGIFFATSNDNIYLFLRERYSDLGLKEMGYKLVSQKKDKDYIVTEWLPERANIKDNAEKIVLAHQNDLPVYMALYSKGRCEKKIYYSGYSMYGSYFLPARIVEITYVKSDSIVLKKEYSNYRIGMSAQSPYFEFTIPSNAKIITQQ